MEKKWNKWFIIAGLALLIYVFASTVTFAKEKAIDFFWVFYILGNVLLVFGAVNYSKWSTKTKIIATIVFSIILGAILFAALFVLKVASVVSS